MSKKLEETFNLPSMDYDDDPDLAVEDEDVSHYDEAEMRELMHTADKIDAALPQVTSLEKADADYDAYADKAMETFDELVDLGKNVEDRHAADIFNAASSMMSNALNAKTNKAQKKLEMVKLQIQKAKLEHEKEKLEYLKKRHLKASDVEEELESEGRVVSTRNDLMSEILNGLNNPKNG